MTVANLFEFGRKGLEHNIPLLPGTCSFSISESGTVQGNFVFILSSVNNIRSNFKSPLCRRSIFSFVWIRLSFVNSNHPDAKLPLLTSRFHDLKLCTIVILLFLWCSNRKMNSFGRLCRIFFLLKVESSGTICSIWLIEKL